MLPERIVIDSAANAPAPGDTPANGTARARRISWAQDMFNFPEGDAAPRPERVPDTAADNALVTGSVEAKKGRQAGREECRSRPIRRRQPGGTLVPVDPQMPAGERAILERLGERRQELEARARELEIRENLLKSAEKRLETRGSELKEMETRAGRQRPEARGKGYAQLKSLVIMYENMKAKDAARIFDRLEMRVLLEGRHLRSTRAGWPTSWPRCSPRRRRTTDGRNGEPSQPGRKGVDWQRPAQDREVGAAAGPATRPGPAWKSLNSI